MNQDKELHEVQMKYCEDIITRLSKFQYAYPFLDPVDPVKLGIPDYPEKIKSPMDMSTIRKKIKNNEYASTNAFKEDFMLMFSNCYIYNDKDSPVHTMGLDLEKQFLNLFNKMPTIETLQKKKRKTDPKESIAVEAKKTKKAPVKDSIKGDDYKLCEDILNELLKSKYQNVMWPFMEPITDDVVPGYSLVIKNPTDLKTIRKKLTDGHFETVDEFYKELKLMVQNCFKFNSDVKKIYDSGIEVDRLTETLFNREKSQKQEIIKKIGDLRNSIGAMEKEIEVLEEALSEEERGKRVTKEYSLEDRLEIGRLIGELNQIQTTRIAQIVCKSGINIDFVNKNEIEVDLRILPDGILHEIEEYVKNVGASRNKENIQYDNQGLSMEL